MPLMIYQFVALLAAGCLVGCGSETSSETPTAPATSSEGTQKETHRSYVDSEEAGEAVRSARSYLVDLEGKIRNGRPENWRVSVASARDILGNIRIELDKLVRAGFETGNLRASLGTLSGVLSSANEDNWRNIASSAQNSINDVRSALSKIEKSI